ncbi:hypothetical protein BDR07DRAFT_1483940 [Suillus spraguei]|nr:hypothetical protein BDR07DRAFT_1483940 [Suillus spraguei]
MRYKAILETSFAFSRTFNPRNIEYCWYALWDQTLSDMVADVPNLIVAPQFPVWVVPGAADEEDENDGDNPEEIVQMKEQPEEAAQEGSSDQTDDEKEGENEVGNISFASTVPQKDAKGVLVDFAILNLMAVAQPLHTERYGGWRITAASVGLLIEVKRFPSRSLEAEDQKSEIIERINEAREDVVQQAGYLFLHDTKMNSVMAIAAAGPYWSGTTIYRGDVKQTMHGLGTRDPSYQPPKEKYPDVTLEWNTLREMGVLDVPAGV